MKKLSLVAFLILHSSSLLGAVIGIDAVHGAGSNFLLGTGTFFSQFRAEISSLGNTIVPLTSFDSAQLAGLDALIIQINTSFITTSPKPYTASEQAAILVFSQKAVFLSDGSLWQNFQGGSDRPISFGDNRKLLDNVVNFSVGGGVVFIGDAGGSVDLGSFNQMTSQFGVTYSLPGTDGNGRTVSGFVPSPITDGISTVGVDFQLPLNIQSPAVDLTTSQISQDKIIAFYSAPEPSTIALFSIGAIGLLFARRRFAG